MRLHLHYMKCIIYLAAYNLKHNNNQVKFQCSFFSFFLE